MYFFQTWLKNLLAVRACFSIHTTRIPGATLRFNLTEYDILLLVLLQDELYIVIC